jgi:hypothetical protein
MKQLGATVHNLVAQTTWRLGFVHRCPALLVFGLLNLKKKIAWTTENSRICHIISFSKTLNFAQTSYLFGAGIAQSV